MLINHPSLKGRVLFRVFVLVLRNLISDIRCSHSSNAWNIRGCIWIKFNNHTNDAKLLIITSFCSFHIWRKTGRRVPQPKMVLELKKSNTTLKKSIISAVLRALGGSSSSEDVIAAAVLLLKTCAARDTFIFFPRVGWMWSGVNWTAFRSSFVFSNSYRATMSFHAEIPPSGSYKETKVQKFHHLNHVSNQLHLNFTTYDEFTRHEIIPCALQEMGRIVDHVNFVTRRWTTLYDVSFVTPIDLNKETWPGSWSHTIALQSIEELAKALR